MCAHSEIAQGAYHGLIMLQQSRPDKWCGAEVKEPGFRQCKVVC